MSTLSLIHELAATTKRGEKEALLYRYFLDGERDFFAGAKLACDPLITFGVQKAALIEDTDDGSGSLPFAEFAALASALRARTLTGHAARDAINAAAARSPVDLWNLFYRRILLKDLKVGVDAKTINKVLKKAEFADADAPDYRIPLFALQLAEDGARPEHAAKLHGRKLLDVKLDGVRLVSVLDKNAAGVSQVMRTGKVNENFVALRDALTRLKDALPGSVALDGEVVSTSFQELMTQVNRRENVDTSTARLALFDIVPLDEFQAGHCARTQEERHAALAALETSGMLRTLTNGLVYVIPKREVDLDTPEGQAAFAEFNREAIEAGYEGIMIKDTSAPYEGRRTASWLKQKPFVEVSLTITAVEEGDPEGKYTGMLGAFVCEGEDDGRKIVVNVGSGFSDAERRAYWDDRERMPGMIVEVRADALTKERGSDVYSLRFPRWKGFRGSVPGEKI